MRRRELLSLLSLGLLAQHRAEAKPAKAASLWQASAYREGMALQDYWVSEKYDGIRGHWDGHQLLTRSGKMLSPPPWFTQNWPLSPFEGELWAGRGKFESAASVLQKKQASDDEWRRLQFMVFDMPKHPGTFTQRWSAYQQLVDQLAQPWVQAVAHRGIDSSQELKDMLTEALKGGAEGLMLHLGTAPYKPGRSADQLKVKPLEDAEAQVVGYEPGQRKHEKRTGALWLQTPQGIRFKLGTGLSDAVRQNPPAMGEWVTYTYQGKTTNGTPRFASYLRKQPRIDR
jgi:DNA ligase-1